jgi:hypothetical protein
LGGPYSIWRNPEDEVENEEGKKLESENTSGFEHVLAKIIFKNGRDHCICIYV